MLRRGRVHTHNLLNPPPQPGRRGRGFQISVRTKWQRRRENDDDSVYGGNQGNGIGHAAVHTRNSHTSARAWRTHTHYTVRGTARSHAA